MLCFLALRAAQLLYAPLQQNLLHQSNAPDKKGGPYKNLHVQTSLADNGGQLIVEKRCSYRVGNTVATNHVQEVDSLPQAKKKKKKKKKTISSERLLFSKYSLHLTM